jgi:hypothetical protein
LGRHNNITKHCQTFLALIIHRWNKKFVQGHFGSGIPCRIHPRIDSRRRLSHEFHAKDESEKQLQPA